MPWYNGDVKKDVVMMKTKQRAVIAVAVIVLLAAAILGAKPMYNLYRDISFYHGERTEAEKTVKAFAEEKGISYGEYPQSLIDLYERNPETKDFVLNYPFRKDTGVDLSAWKGSRTVPLFLQWNPMWGYERYGKDFLAVTGCGPTCLAMVGYYLTGDENMNPRQVAQFAQENGYYSRGSGSSWTLISEGSGGLGLKATEIPLVKKKMVDALDCLALAEQAGSSKAVNIVLMGRLSHYFDLPEEAWQASLEAMVPPKFLELNKKAFQLGKNA